MYNVQKYVNFMYTNIYKHLNVIHTIQFYLFLPVDTVNIFNIFKSVFSIYLFGK